MTKKLNFKKDNDSSNLLSNLRIFSRKSKEHVKKINVFQLDEIPREVAVGGTTKFSGSHLIALLFWVIVFCLLFVIDQSSSMIKEYFSSRPFPAITVFWIGVFSLSLFVFMKCSYSISKNKLFDTNGRYIRNNVNTFILMFPYSLVIATLFILYSGPVDGISNQWFNFLLMAVFIISYYGIVAIILSLNFSTEKRMISFYWASFILLGLISFLGGLFYVLGIRIGGVDSSVDIINILLIALIFWRAVLLLLKWMILPGKDLLEFVSDKLNEFISRAQSTNSGISDGFKSNSIIDIRGVSSKYSGRFIAFAFVMSLMFVVSKDYYKFEVVENVDDRACLDVYAKNWLTRFNKDVKSNKENIYIVAGQGGGSRAGFWISSGLDGLSNRIKGFDRGLFALSTVSGSSVGASMFYMSRTDKHGEINKVDDHISLSEGYKNYFKDDFVTKPIINYLLVNHIGKMFNWDDRNDVLQETMSDSYSDHIKDHSADVSKKYSMEKFPIKTKNDSLGPILALNTYNITDKKRAVASSVRISSDHDWVDDILESVNGNLNFSDAVNLSEMFPFLSASAKIEYPANISNSAETKEKRFYDGGVFENYGVTTLMDIYRILSSERCSVAQEDRKRIVAIIFRNNIKDLDPEESSFFDNSLKSVQDAAMNSIFVSHPQEELMQFEILVRSKGDTVLYFDFDEEVSLNRWISGEDINKMSLKNDNVLETVQKQLDTLSSKEFKGCGVENLAPISKPEVILRVPGSNADISPPVQFDLDNRTITVYFNHGLNTLTRNRIAEIEKNVEILKDMTNGNILVTGYADHSGPPGFDNIALTTQRAGTVRLLLSRLKQLEGRSIIELPGMIINQETDSLYDPTSDYERAIARRAVIKFE